MTEISRVALFGKLNSMGYKAIEGATVFCKMRGNPYVEIVHWLAQIVQLPDSDFHRIIEHYKIDPARLSSDMTAALDALPRGASTISDLSQRQRCGGSYPWNHIRREFKPSAIQLLL